MYYVTKVERKFITTFLLKN